MVSEVKISNRQILAIIETEKKIKKSRRWQTNITETIVQAAAEAARVEGQDMAAARTENNTRHQGTQNVRPK